MTWATITTFIGLAGWISAFVMLFIIPVNRKPSSAIAWLLLIFLLPFLGLLIFLLIGSPKLPKHRRAQQRTMDEFIRQKVRVLMDHLGSRKFPNFSAREKLFENISRLTAALQ